MVVIWSYMASTRLFYCHYRVMMGVIVGFNRRAFFHGLVQVKCGPPLSGLLLLFPFALRSWCLFSAWGTLSRCILLYCFFLDSCCVCLCLFASACLLLPFIISMCRLPRLVLSWHLVFWCDSVLSVRPQFVLPVLVPAVCMFFLSLLLVCSSFLTVRPVGQLTPLLRSQSPRPSTPFLVGSR